MLGEWIAALVEWVGGNPHWAGFFVFLIALAESLAIVGMVVPGVVMMFAAGALIGAGAVDFWPMYWLAVAGAVAGDGLSFWLGRALQDRVTGIWPFSRHPESLERGVEFFRRYGGKSVAIGRFFGPVRAVIPLVAGMLSMPPWRFVLANVASALAWAVAYLAPGIVFGASLELASEVAFRLVGLVLALVILLWFAGWAGHRIFLRIQPLSSELVQWLLRRQERPGMAGRMAAALADPDHPEARGLAVLAGVLVLATIVFGLLLGGVLGTAPFAGADRFVGEWLSSLRTPVADHLMVLLTAPGDSWWLALVALAVFAALRIDDRRSAWYWMAAVAFAFVAPMLVKFALQVPRPHTPEGYSQWGFPSAHALRTVVIYGFLAVVASSLSPAGSRWPYYLVAMLMAVLVGFSRVYLGVHWLSDVLGGVVLGLLWVAALGIAYRHHPHGYPRRRRVAVALVAASLVAVMIQFGYRQEAEVVRYAVPRTVTEMPVALWLSGEPGLVANTGLAGGRLMPNLEYAGPLAGLRGAFEDDGWADAQPLGWGNALKLLAPSLPVAELPVLPRVYDGRHEELLLVRDGDEGRRLVLRAWPADVRLDPGGDPVWIAGIGVLERRVILDFLAYPRERLPDKPAAELLPAGLVVYPPPRGGGAPRVMLPPGLPSEEPVRGGLPGGPGSAPP